MKSFRQAIRCRCALLSVSLIPYLRSIYSLGLDGHTGMFRHDRPSLERRRAERLATFAGALWSASTKQRCVTPLFLIHVWLPYLHKNMSAFVSLARTRDTHTKQAMVPIPLPEDT